MTQKTEETKGKKAAWKLEGDFATITFPNGESETFDFSKMDEKVSAFYGRKQILGDFVAGLPMDEKPAAMRAAYDEFVAGVELTTDGRIRVLSRVRTNAKTNDEKALALGKRAEDAQSILKTMELGLLKLSDEAIEKLKRIVDDK